MDWKNFWNNQAKRYSDPQAQVARINRGKIPGPEVIERITQYIASLLDLQPTDSLLDVCCGNGLLTKPLSQLCKETVGVDLSPAQIEVANHINANDTLRYDVGDAENLTQTLTTTFDKISLYFSFQYLDTFAKGKHAITEMVSLLNDGGKILIGDVPEKKYLNRYYPTVVERLRYKVRNLRGKNDMGKFWSFEEIQKICKPLGVGVRRLEQPEDLPFAYYRCDFLIEKGN